MKIFNITVWPVQHWRIVLLIRLSWKVSSHIASRAPDWFRRLPEFIGLVPELIIILLESLQIKARLREALVVLVLNPLARLWTLLVLVCTPRTTLSHWWKKGRAWAREKPRQVALMRRLETAANYEEWVEIANLLDESYGTIEWYAVFRSSRLLPLFRLLFAVALYVPIYILLLITHAGRIRVTKRRHNPESRDYDYRDVTTRVQRLRGAIQQDDIHTITRIVRSGLIRNMVNIAEPALYDKAFAGTKFVIEDYADALGAGVRHVTAMKTWPRHPSHPSGYDIQSQLDFLRTCRLGFGRSTLLLQGGAMFGFSHLGVAKALYLQNVLPRVITGSGSGALAAALLCIRTNEELTSLFNGENIDLSALGPERRASRRQSMGSESAANSPAELVRQLALYVCDQCCVDINVLAECARDNIGDMTFEEAYMRTKRVLNISMPIPRKWSRRNMFNFLETPHVLIRSAIVASNVKYSPFSPVTVYCKDRTGAIVSYHEKASFRAWLFLNYEFRESPLYRLSELFNVNHFIVSQSRPYLLPIFYRTTACPGNLPHRKLVLFPLFFDWLRLEIRHRLDQIDSYGLLPSALYRVLLAEDYPNMTLAILPKLSPLDYFWSFCDPMHKNIRQWILMGERGTWPAMSAIKVRSILEVELEKGYQVYQRKQDNSIYDPYS